MSPASPPWQRLAYDELLAGQLALALVRQSFKSQPGRSVAGDGRIRARIADALPFALTNSQRQALEGDRRGHGLRRTACCACCRATSAPARPWWR